MSQQRLGSAPERAAGGPWWSGPFEMFQTNLREIDADLDVEATLDAITDHGADSWLLNTGGILSWYPSDLDFQTRNPHLRVRPSGDLIGDALAAASARGVRVLSRMDFSKVQPHLAQTHPEWCFRSPSGELQVFEGLVSVCPSGEYYQQRMFDVVDEVVDRYDVAGFFFNWFGFNEVDYAGRYRGVCHCDACAEGFGRRFGAELPDGPEDPAYVDWTVFAAEVVALLTVRCREHLAARRPDVALILGKKADIVFHEANNAVGRTLWPHATDEAVSAARSLRPDAPVLVNSVAFVDMPYRMGAEQPEHLEQYFVQAVARGAQPSTYIMGPPGRISYPSLHAARRVTRFRAAHREVYDGLRPVADVALLQPDRVGTPADRHAQETAEFRGLYTALVQTHVPFDVVALAALGEARALSRYRTVVVPDLGDLRGYADVLDDFVQQGGTLVLTGGSGLHDGAAVLATAPGLVEEARSSGEELKSSYVEVDAQAVPVVGERLRLRWHPSAEHRGGWVPRAPYGPPEKAYGHRLSDEAGWAVRRSGDGVVVQLPWSLGRDYRQLGLTSVRDLLTSALAEGPRPRAVVAEQLPEQVSVVVGASGEDLVVHLDNLSGQRGNGFGPPLPVNGARLRFPGAAGRRVRVLVSDDAPSVHEDGKDLVVRLPELGLFEVVVVAGGQQQ